MEQRTKVAAEEGRQDLLITRTFEVPVALLFRGYTDADIVAQWMGTRVLKLESHPHGSYRFETTDPRGGKHYFNGTIHTCDPDSLIVRTFEMEGTPFEPQLEFLEFEALSGNSSKLSIHIIYRSAALRDQMLQLPFRQGISMAHDRLETIIKNLNKTV